MLPWPDFWNHIPETDRPLVRQCVSDLLRTGALLGDEGSARDLYVLARDTYFKELSEYFAILNIELIPDGERPIMQARPIPGECELVASFSKDETLLVLTLWRIYDESHAQNTMGGAVLTANDLWLKLKLFFAGVEPPTPSHLDRMLSKLRRRRLIRFQRQDDPTRFGESVIEVLPTLTRAIPFANLEAWEAQAALYQEGGTEQKA